MSNANMKSRKLTFAKAFAGAMVVVGVYAVVRHGSELAYAFGKFVGSS